MVGDNDTNGVIDVRRCLDQTGTSVCGALPGIASAVHGYWRIGSHGNGCVVEHDERTGIKQGQGQMCSASGTDVRRHCGVDGLES